MMIAAAINTSLQTFMHNGSRDLDMGGPEPGDVPLPKQTMSNGPLKDSHCNPKYEPRFWAEM